MPFVAVSDSSPWKHQKFTSKQGNKDLNQHLCSNVFSLLVLIKMTVTTGFVLWMSYQLVREYDCACVCVHAYMCKTGKNKNT